MGLRKFSWPGISHRRCDLHYKARSPPHSRPSSRAWNPQTLVSVQCGNHCMLDWVLSGFTDNGKLVVDHGQ